MATQYPDSSGVTWRPDPDRLSRTHMYRFIRFAAAAAGQQLDDYDELHHWSVTEAEEFWSVFADYADVRFSRRADRVLEYPESMPGARWFSGAKLNFAERLLFGSGEQIVLVGIDERGTRRQFSRSELRSLTASLAAELRAMGVGQGDRIAALLPNCPEAVIALLASASVGAVFSSCSPDFGVQGVLDRFGQIEPVVLFGCDGYQYAGKQIDCLERLVELKAAMPTVRRVVVVSKRGADSLSDSPSFSSWDLQTDFVVFDSLLRSGASAAEDFVQVDFNHPLAILYSSGTTGKPKCIVHGAGGTLLQHLKELLLHTDLSEQDTLFYFTTSGWMMWNWLVSGLATGARIILYDGAPTYPDISRLWQLAEDEAVTVFGTSPKFLTSCEKSALNIASEFSLARLRTILSTGSPLTPHSFDFIAKEFDGRVQICSISGGTDIISCFALGNPLLPVYRGEMQCVGLGMAVKVFDNEGASVSGGPGELVCTRPFPSMPLGFWNDPGDTKYTAAYFSRFSGVWAHGDIAETTANHGLIIHGRSDAVLNPSGVRIGTAEIYNPVLAMADVEDCVAIGQDWQGDVRIVLFVMVSDNVSFDASLVQRIRDAIRLTASPRHVPARIVQVAEIPRTQSGKVVELAVRAVVHGKPVENIEAIANPQALDEFRDRPELA